METRRNGKMIGDMGQNCTIGELAKFGIHSAVVLSDNLKFDLIAIAGNRLFKIQTKATTHHSYSAARFSITTNNWKKAIRICYQKGDFDIYALYDLLDHRLYLFGFDEIGDQKSVAIRIKPTKYNNHSGRWWEDFVISEKRVKQIFDFEFDFTKYISQCTEHAKIHNLICKGCGSLFNTDNKYADFCSKRCVTTHERKVKNRPEKEELQIMINTMPMTQIGKKYGVCDNSVRKWAKKYGIELPGRLGYWAKQQSITSKQNQ